MTLCAGRAAVAVPPDRRRGWAAEIEWREIADGGRFVALASPNGARTTATIAESPALTWPPADSDSVRALVEAASDLELALVSAGWTPVAPRRARAVVRAGGTPVAPGRAWYAKRFAWDPPSDAACPLPASEIAALFAPRPP